jgi:hypothetical protein
MKRLKSSFTIINELNKEIFFLQFNLKKSQNRKDKENDLNFEFVLINVLRYANV